MPLPPVGGGVIARLEKIREPAEYRHGVIPSDRLAIEDVGNLPTAPTAHVPKHEIRSQRIAPKHEIISCDIVSAAIVCFADIVEASRPQEAAPDAVMSADMSLWNPAPMPRGELVDLFRVLDLALAVMVLARRRRRRLPEL